MRGVIGIDPGTARLGYAIVGWSVVRRACWLRRRDDPKGAGDASSV